MIADSTSFSELLLSCSFRLEALSLMSKFGMRGEPIVFDSWLNSMVLDDFPVPKSS